MKTGGWLLSGVELIAKKSFNNPLIVLRGITGEIEQT